MDLLKKSGYWCSSSVPWMGKHGIVRTLKLASEMGEGGGCWWKKKAVSFSFSMPSIYQKANCSKISR
jgi:hypothetical protein